MPVSTSKQLSAWVVVLGCRFPDQTRRLKRCSHRRLGGHDATYPTPFALMGKKGQIGRSSNLSRCHGAIRVQAWDGRGTHTVTTRDD